MSEESGLEPFGLNDTKRLTVPTAEEVLYHPKKIPHGFWRLVDYMGGDEAIYRAMTGGAGGKVIGNLSQPELFDSAWDMGAPNGFKFAHLKLHVRMPIQSALFWVYREAFSINEYSGRYSVMLDSGRELPREEIEMLLARQLEGLPSARRDALIDRAGWLYDGARETAKGAYKLFLATNLARELARIGLGLGTHTEFYVSATLTDYLNAITDAKALAIKHPLYEHLGPEADELEAIVEQVAPEAFASYRRKLEGKLKPVQIRINREALEQRPDGQPRYGISKTKRLTVEEAEKILWLPQVYLEEGWFLPSDYMGSDESIVQAARVSYGRGTTKTSTDRILTRYLRRHLHTTPSEQVELQAEQCTPIFVWPRQGGRHRTADKEGVLGAFVPLRAFYRLPDDEIREQAPSNRQGRGDLLEERSARMVKQGLAFTEDAERLAYEELVRSGIPEDVSDNILGVGFFTRGTVKTDLHNLIHFLNLRVDAHAQREIQLNGQQWKGFLKAVAPWSHEAFIDYQREAVTLMGPEIPFVRRMITEGRRNIPDKWFSEAGWTKTVKGQPVPNREADELRAKIKRLGLPVKEQEESAGGEATE